MWWIGILILIIILGSFAYASLRAIGWVPIWSKDVKNVIKLADIKEGEKFCDLGCGEGKVVVAAGRAGAKATGYEISILFYIIAKIRSWFSRGKVKIRFKDFWLIDLSDMDIVFFFLIPKIYPKMKTKLQKELKPGARVIAYVWPFDDWEPEQVIKRDKAPAIYLYKIKATD